MQTFFTSDFHWNHLNCIKYENRPFKSLDDMNNTIIHHFNERVKESDRCYIIGDLNFKSGSGRGEGEPKKPKELFSQLICKNIIIIEGNHDKDGRNGFKAQIQSLVINYGGTKMNLVHNPDHADFRYKINLVGHVHGKWRIERRFDAYNRFTDCINVGVDVWNFYPVSWDEINSRYIRWKKEYEKTN